MLAHHLHVISTSTRTAFSISLLRQMSSEWTTRVICYKLMSAVMN